MLRATVVGRIWSTKRLEEMPTGTILEIQVHGGHRLLAFDPLGCGDGEEVIVTTGSVAANWFNGAIPPIDALIVGSIDEVRPSRDSSKS
jgi:ethanolamine utilization protein EutN